MIVSNIYNYFMDTSTLNIFCDASIREKNNNKFNGCYGAIAMCRDLRIDELLRISTDTTNNNSEIKAIRAGVELAIQNKNNFKNINILSDSQISILGIRDRYPTWIVKDDKLYGKTNQLIKSQEIYCEILYLLQEYQPRVLFWHQNGHVNLNSEASLQSALHVFMSSNQIRDYIDMDLIKYISKYNDMIDNETRKKVWSVNLRGVSYIEPVYFTPVNYYAYLNNYNKPNFIGGYNDGQFYGQ